MQENLKKIILENEIEFNNLKRKVSYYHKLFLIFYFLPIIILIIIVSTYFEKIFNFVLKFIIYVFFTFGLLIHFFLRYKFYKSKNRYKKFFDKKLNYIKNFYTDNDFNKKIIDVIKEIFNERNIEVNKKNIMNEDFFYLFINNLKINLDNF